MTDAAADLVAVCRRLSAAGLSPGASGNVSVRSGDELLVTPTGSALSRVLPEQLARLDAGTGERRGGPAPSKEAPLHLAMLRSGGPWTAVVHLHAAWATAIACLPGADGAAALPVFTPYRAMRLGRVPLVPYAPPGSAELAAGVAEAAATGSAVLLLAHHGPVIAARDPQEAADLAEELENACQVAMLLQGTAAVPLAPDVAPIVHR